MEAYYTLVGLSQDLKRSFELLEVLLPAFFRGSAAVFQEDLKFNGNNRSSFSVLQAEQMHKMKIYFNQNSQSCHF